MVMKHLTFAERVAYYLDQYKASQPQNGQFISVDPDGDGEKHAIFVSDSGKVNPKSDNPGQWDDFRPGRVSTGKSKKQHRDSPGQLGTHDDPFTGKYRRKPEKQQRLDDSEPVEDATPDWVDDDDAKPEKKKNRLPRGFREAVVGTFLPPDATAEELHELNDAVQQVIAEQAEIVQAGQDALRQVFGDARKLTGAQAQARAANDPDAIVGFDTAVAEIASSGGYKDDRSTLQDIAAYLEAGATNWAKGSGGETSPEMIVFEALRRPLPQPPRANDPAVLAIAAERMYGSSEQDTRSKEERNQERQVQKLVAQANEAMADDDWDLYEMIREQIMELDPGYYTDDVDEFQAITFREAVARYAGQLGLWDDEFTGKFRTKDQKQGKLFNSKGEAWKNQPRKKKGEKGGGQWTKGSSPTTPAMDAAREKLAKKSTEFGYEQRRSQRRTVESALKKYGTQDKLEKAKPHELSQQEYLIQQAFLIEQKRQQTLSGTSEAEKFLQKLKSEGNIHWADAADSFQEIEGWEKVAKRFGYKKGMIVYGIHMRSFFGWLEKATLFGTPIPQDLKNITLSDLGMFFIPQETAVWQRTDMLKDMLTKHRNAVRTAVKKGLDVAEKSYEQYRESDWIPGGAQIKKRAAAKYCKEVDQIKEKDKFRLNASVGRKLKTAANKYVNKARKNLLEGRKKLGKEIDELQAAIDKHLENEGRPYPSQETEEYQKWRAEYDAKKEKILEMRDKQFSYFTDWIKKLPSNRLRQEGAKPGVEVSHNETGKPADNIAKAAQFIEEASGGAVPNVRIGLNKTRKNRSYASGGDIYMNKHQMTVSTLVHEIGHAIDWQTDQGRKTKAFEAQAIQKHKTNWTGGGCKSNEVGSKNGFMRAYSGKYYDHPRCSEVLSMGIQHLYGNPIKFAEESPDHFNFTVASLRGLL